MRPLTHVDGWPAGDIAEHATDAGERRSSSDAFGAKTAHA
jgi:hypothetical protein